MTHWEALRICLERYAIGSDHWNDDLEWKSIMPDNVIRELYGENPTMLCKSPRNGWFVLGLDKNGNAQLIWTQNK